MKSTTASKTAPATDTSRVKKAPSSPLQRSSLTTAFLFLLPNFIGFLAFTVFPVLFSLYMAFTNWSLKPAVELQMVGGRNFSDLLWVRELGDGTANTLLLVAFLGSVLLVSLGFLATLWVNISGKSGIRFGGLLLIGTGLAIIVLAIFSGAGQHVYLGGGVFLLIGASNAAKGDESFRPGVASIPPALIVLGAVGIGLLNGGMWEAYEMRDVRFWQYFYNTAYLMLGIPIGIAGSLWLAMMLNNEFTLNSTKWKVSLAGLCLIGGLITFAVAFPLNENLAVILTVLWVIAALGALFNVITFRTLFYLPQFTAGVALLILWKALYNPETGPINVMIENLGMALGFSWEGPQWLSSVEWSKPALIIMGTWIAIGGTSMLLYLAGLSNLQQELLDAADVDGANKSQRFKHIIWPQLAPTTFFITITAVIAGLQGGFEQARVMTQGGPAGSTTTLSYYIYNKAFQDLDLGYASAISWVLFAVIFIATALNWKFGRELEVEST